MMIQSVKYTLISIFILLSFKPSIGQNISCQQSNDNQLIVRVDSAIIGKDILITTQIDRGSGFLARPIPMSTIIRLSKSENGTILSEKRALSERCDSTAGLFDAFRASNHKIYKEPPFGIKQCTNQQYWEWNITPFLLKMTEFKQHKLNKLRYSAKQNITIDNAYVDDNTLIICFTAHYLKNREEFLNGISLTGTIPVQFSCALTILREQRMKPLIAAKQIPSHRLIPFTDFSSSLHHSSKQYIVERWNPNHLPTISIDHHMPALYLEAINREIQYYNNMLQEIGCPSIFKIEKLSKGQQTAEKKCLISYDFESKDMQSYTVTDSVNGEILYGRLNMGIGSFHKALIDNIWIEGINDSNRVKNPFTPDYTMRVVRQEFRKKFLEICGGNKNNISTLHLSDFWRQGYSLVKENVMSESEKSDDMENIKVFLDGWLNVLAMLNEEIQMKNDIYSSTIIKEVLQAGYSLYISKIKDICKLVNNTRDPNECLALLYHYWTQDLEPHAIKYALLPMKIVSSNRVSDQLTRHICESLFTEVNSIYFLNSEQGKLALMKMFNLLFKEYDTKQLLTSNEMNRNYQIIQYFMKLHDRYMNTTTTLALNLIQLKVELKHKIISLYKKHQNVEMRCYYEMLLNDLL